MDLTVCSILCLLSCLLSSVAASTSVPVSPESGSDIELDAVVMHFATIISDAVPRLPNLTWIPSIDAYSPAVRVDHSSKSESAICLRDLLFVIEQMSVKAGHSLPDWFVAMADSVGKIPAGVTAGALSWPGYFRQCQEVRAGNRFSGRYCSVYWSVGLNNGSLVVPLTQGLCVPNSCSSADMLMHIRVLSDLIFRIPNIRKITENRIRLQNVYCHPRPEERHLDGPAVASISAFFVFLAITVIATVVDVLLIHKHPAVSESGDFSSASSSDEPTSSSSIEEDCVALTSTDSSDAGTRRRSLLIRILTSFSLYSNARHLFSSETFHRNREISSLHGIRFLSMSWVMLCHSYLFSLSVTNNLLDLMKDSDSLSYFVILNGSFCVDSFFVLSGLLLSYHFFAARLQDNDNDEGKHLRNPILSSILLILKRIYRILPLYVAVLIFDANISHHGSSGPFWDYGDQVTSEKVMCSQSAWYNLLFINNFLPLQQQCMAWTWYLASDMQFFLLSPILLFLIKRNRKIGLAVLVSLLMASVTVTWVVSYTNNLGSGFTSMIKHPDPASITTYLDTIYTKPYARAGPFLIGMLVGILLVEERQIHITRGKRVIAHVVACLLLVLVLFGTYHSPANRLSDAFYNSLSRISWAFLVCLIIVLTSGKRDRSRNTFSPIRSLLSSSFFVPLSKLTYCAYLIHPLVINFYYRTLQEPLLYNGSGMLSIYLSNVVAVFLISIPVHLMFEAPFAQVLKSL